MWTRLIGSILLPVLLVPSTAAGQDAELGKERLVHLRDGESTTVRLRLSGASRNILSVVSFPNDIREVISAWDPKSLSIEHTKRKLFLKILSKVEGHLDVVLSDRHYRLFLKPVGEKDPYDSHVAVTPPDEKKPTKTRRFSFGALELVRAMRLGTVPTGTTVRSGKNEILSSRSGFTIRIHYVYETPRYRGIVLGFSNDSAKEDRRIDPTKWTAERLVLIGSRDILVRPGRSTRLYLVFWK